MELVGMTLWQSFVVPAELAIDEKVLIQEVDCQWLKARLIKDGQKL